MNSLKTAKTARNSLPNLARAISVASRAPKLAPSEILSNKNLPTGTGSGPFIELPDFTPLGSPSHILNVTVPRSSHLNIRSGAVVAINGDLAAVSGTTQQLSENTEYQALYTESPLSLLVNGDSKTGSSSRSYSVIEVDDLNEKWTILSDNSIVAWTGYDFQLDAAPILEKHHSFVTNGKGSLVVSGQDQLFDVVLQKDEQMSINPASLVATTAVFGPEVLGGTLRQKTAQLSDWMPFSVPSFGLGLAFSIIKGAFSSTRGRFSDYYRHFLSRQPTIGNYLTLGGVYWRKMATFLRLHVYVALFKRAPIFYRVKGPGRLLISNRAMEANTNTFSYREIEHIFKG